MIGGTYGGRSKSDIRHGTLTECIALPASQMGCAAPFASVALRPVSHNSTLNLNPNTAAFGMFDVRLRVWSNDVLEFGPKARNPTQVDVVVGFDDHFVALHSSRLVADREGQRRLRRLHAGKSAAHPDICKQ
jgi:hypothetical protein